MTDKILDAILKVVNRWGVKWLVATMFGIASLYLVYIDKARDFVGVAGAVVVAALYFWFRNREHEKKAKK